MVGGELQHYFVLCREAHQLLRWQPVHAFYSKLKGANGRKKDDWKWWAPQKPRGTSTFHLPRVSSPILLKQSSVIWNSNCYCWCLLFLRSPAARNWSPKDKLNIFNFQDKVKSHMPYLSGSSLPFFTGYFLKKFEPWWKRVRENSRIAEEVEISENMGAKIGCPLSCPFSNCQPEGNN